MSQKPSRLGLSAALGLMLAAAVPAQANDAMFPPAPAAQSAIAIDGHGFVINGKRTFIVSGSLHFARLPRAQWREMLMKFKRAGYNTVQTYVFWNWQEPREGQWDFTGSHDLNAFLKLVKQMGMYATVRVGPYCCAEWDSGGFPVWLRFKPGLMVRQDDPAFMTEAGKWYAKILPIVAANQINHGGSVILLQMENEDKTAWGTDIPNSYFQKLHDIALQNGIQVPFFFSGLHHGSDPAGRNPWSNAGRTSPWYSTEFWAGWIGRFGPPTPSQLLSIVREDWKIQAYGGNGYNHYMMYGGTNFGSYNNDEDAASYDYGAAISQSGGLRSLYYQDKRAALFATSFPDILENSSDATTQYASAATAPGVRVTARQGPAGTILYLDNSGKTPVDTQVKDASGELFPDAGPLTLAPGEIMPVVLDAPIAPGIKLQNGAARILGIAHQGNTTTIVTYSEPGSHGQLNLVGDDPVGVKNLQMPLTFPTDRPWERIFTEDSQTVRVLALSPALADRTWFVTAGGQRYVVVGPEYVGEASIQNGRLLLTTEAATNSVLADPAGGRVWVYGAGAKPVMARTLPSPASGTPYTPLQDWQMHPGDAEAAASFDDASWLASSDPQQMGADGNPGAYAWYRATVTVPTGGKYRLHFADAGDWLRVFVDGHPGAASTVVDRDKTAVPRDIPVTLTAGRHTLAVLTAQYGRDKIYSYFGLINQIAAKGLNGPVTLTGGTGTADVPITGWRMRGGVTGMGGRGWHALGASAPGVPTFYRATFRYEVGPTGSHPVLRATFAGLSRGFLYLNGHNLGRYPEKCPTDSLYLPSAYLKPGVNTLAVFDEDGQMPTQVALVPDAEGSHTTTLLTAPLP